MELKDINVDDMIINDSSSYVKAFYEMQRRCEIYDEERGGKMKFIKVKDVKSPVRAHSTDAGIDFFIPNDFETVTLKPGEDVCIASGVKVIVPRGYALIFKEKSGVALKKKLTIGAAVVDSDYRGEVHLHLFNNGLTEQTLEAGDKITQGLVVPISLCELEEVTEEEYNKFDTERADGGFGSTGSK